jgi:hypothetical protein
LIATAAVAGMAAYLISLGNVDATVELRVRNPVELKAYMLSLSHVRPGADSSLNVFYNGIRPSDIGLLEGGPVSINLTSKI